MPCVAKTKILLRTIYELRQQGKTIADITEMYPRISKRKLKLVIEALEYFKF